MQKRGRFVADQKQKAMFNKFTTQQLETTADNTCYTLHRFIAVLQHYGLSDNPKEITKATEWFNKHKADVISRKAKAARRLFYAKRF
jgi:hypothetical protein